MNRTFTADALTLRAMAAAFDDPHRSPEPITVAQQIRELGTLNTKLADEVLLRAAKHNYAQDAREAAVSVVKDALATADTALCDGANSLHAASTVLLPAASARLHAARSRFLSITGTTPVASSPAPTGSPAAAARHQ